VWASNITGFILNLEKDICRIPLLSGEQRSLSIGDAVYRSKDIVRTMCGLGVLGEVINPLGFYLVPTKLTRRQQLSDKLFKTRWAPVEIIAPGISKRSPVSVPFMTGVVAVDCFLPIGCGQRELIIGDHNTGKTSLAITAILNQGFRNTVIGRA
jgi:F0F1-type ATP synthase alpha subunit